MPEGLIPSPGHRQPSEYQAPGPATLPTDLLEGAEEGVPWGRYWSAVRRYKWLILAITVVGSALGAMATRFVIPVYTAISTIMIEPDADERGPIRAEGLLRSTAWLELLNTGVVLDSVAIKMGLYITPERESDRPLFERFELAKRSRTGAMLLRVSPQGDQVTLELEDGTVLDRVAPGDSIGKDIGFRWAPPATLLRRDRTVHFTVVTPFDASRDLRNRLRPNMVRDGNFLTLAFEGTDPNQVAATLNAVTSQFISVAAEQKRLKLSVQVQTLEDQLARAAENLREAENRLEQYRVTTITLPNERTPVAAGLQVTQAPVLSRFFEQRTRLDELRQDREALEGVLSRIRAGTTTTDAFQLIPAARSAPELGAALDELATSEVEARALALTFTEEYPPLQDVRRRTQTLRTEVIPYYASSLIAQLREQERVLQGQISEASQELEEIPVRTTTEQRLTREASSAEALFRMLQTNHEETKFALASSIPDVRLLDPAVPPSRPSRNRAPTIVLLAFVGSIALAIAIAILLDRMDRRVRYPDQVTRGLGLSILGAVPEITKLRSGGQNSEEASQVVEAFRTIRLNLVHSYGTAGPLMLTISSPSPGDGKSLVTANLALSFTEAGYNTLLVDGDIRRGEAHRMFGINRQPGLLDALVREATLDEVLKPTAHRGLTLLPSGTRRHHGPELLSSTAMTDVLAAIKTRFDVILVDSPPLGAGIDPFVLGTATGNLLLVLRSGETDRDLAEAKLNLTTRLPIRVLGAVLNNVRTQERQYRYYSYVYSYMPEDQPALGPLRPEVSSQAKKDG